MRRHNYAPTALTLALTAAAERFGNVRLRGPAPVSVAAALALVAATAAVELHRLARLDMALTITSERTARTAAAAAHLGSLEGELEHLRHIDAALTSARRTALGSVNDLVLLGNRLPAQTWLTRIHSDRDGTWAIDGRAIRIPEIGRTLEDVQAIDPAAQVRLLSLAGIGERARTLRFSLTWERVSP